MYCVPIDRKIGTPLSASCCSRRCTLTPEESERNFHPRKEKGPNPTVLPAIFSSPAALPPPLRTAPPPSNAATGQPQFSAPDRINCPDSPARTHGERSR